MNAPDMCPVCGGREFSYNDVLWPELISEWGLLQHEVEYINRQQGLSCASCGNNLRSMSLSDAVLKRYGFHGVLKDFVANSISEDIKVLEINEAGGLTATLSNMPNHVLIKYPEYNMENLAIESDSFDLIVHSDTLEHVNDPVLGLTECKRVLKQSGACIYTTPIIVERLSRTRQGLKQSFHGNNSSNDFDLVVCTEFGSDFWKYPILSGFNSVKINAFEYPAALSIEIE